MADFLLLDKLNEEKDKKKPKLAEGIKYQKYEMVVDGKTQIVNIPLRECLNFEKELSEINKSLTRKDLKILLRKYRGIRD